MYFVLDSPLLLNPMFKMQTDKCKGCFPVHKLLCRGFHCNKMKRPNLQERPDRRRSWLSRGETGTVSLFCVVPTRDEGF